MITVVGEQQQQLCVSGRTCRHVMRMCCCVAENDPAVVYSAVRPAEDLSYGQVVFKDKKTSRTRGTADLYS